MLWISNHVCDVHQTNITYSNSNKCSGIHLRTNKTVIVFELFKTTHKNDGISISHTYLYTGE